MIGMMMIMKLIIMIQGPSDSPKFLKSKMRSFPTSLDVFWEPPSASSINGEFLGQKQILKRKKGNHEIFPQDTFSPTETKAVKKEQQSKLKMNHLKLRFY